MSRSSTIIGVVAVMCWGCSTPPEDDGKPPIVAEPCEAAPTEDFTLGVVIFDNPRWFQAFDEDCNTIELQTGLQGGWHVEPALQAPRSAASMDLGGRILWSVRDAGGNVVGDAEFELFRNFWQKLEGGDAYWGDFVIFDRDPARLVGTSLTIECTLEFDERSNQTDVVLERTVTLVDEVATTEFQ